MTNPTLTPDAKEKLRAASIARTIRGTKADAKKIAMTMNLLVTDKMTVKEMADAIAEGLYPTRDPIVLPPAATAVPVLVTNKPTTTKVKKTMTDTATTPIQRTGPRVTTAQVLASLSIEATPEILELLRQYEDPNLEAEAKKPIRTKLRSKGIRVSDIHAKFAALQAVGANKADVSPELANELDGEEDRELGTVATTYDDDTIFDDGDLGVEDEDIDGDGDLGVEDEDQG